MQRALSSFKSDALGQRLPCSRGTRSEIFYSGRSFANTTQPTVTLACNENSARPGPRPCSANIYVPGAYRTTIMRSLKRYVPDSAWITNRWFRTGQFTRMVHGQKGKDFPPTTTSQMKFWSRIQKACSGRYKMGLERFP